jgi:hypothetical protein
MSEIKRFDAEVTACGGCDMCEIGMIQDEDGDYVLFDDLKEIKAQAVMEFVNMMIGGFDSGFTSANNPNLNTIYRAAQNWVKDTYDAETKNIEDAWGEDTARECGLEIK